MGMYACRVREQVFQFAGGVLCRQIPLLGPFTFGSADRHMG